MKLNPKLAAALCNLRGNRDFDTVLEGIQEHTAEELHRCSELEDTKLYRAQGAVKALQTWQQLYVDAPKTLEKFKAQEQPHSQQK